MDLGIQINHLWDPIMTLHRSSNWYRCRRIVLVIEADQGMQGLGEAAWPREIHNVISESINDAAFNDYKGRARPDTTLISFTSDTQTS